jgi:glyoxylase-like metal-dependent hydrolase (beta-lactamase superfamily II)
MANPDESALTYPFGETLPSPGTTLDVAPGVKWLRMALPFALDHINLWLLEDGDGWTAVDCGIANDASRASWEAVFAGELGGRPIRRVLVTHMHPDHIGLAHWLTERWSTAGAECRLWMSATDWHAARAATTSSANGDAAARFLARHGLADTDVLNAVRGRRNYFKTLVPQVPPRFRRLMDGMTLSIGGRAWRCIAGYGHAPEHIALYCEALQVLISGDMVLPRISTNVSVFEAEPEADPLPLYLRSVGSMRALPAPTLVLPSHGRPFTGLHERIGQLLRHHDDRFADVLQACAQAPRSAADLLGVLFRRQLDSHQTTFAMGESIAHLHALAGDGRLHEVDRGDGVLRFAAAGGQR